MTLLAGLVPLVGGLQHLLDPASCMKSDERDQQVDVGIGLHGVGQAGEGLVGVPLGGNPGHDLDDVLVLVDDVKNAVAALDGVHVAEVADQQAGLVFAALLLGDRRPDSVTVQLHDLPVVGLDRDVLSCRSAPADG